MKHSISMSFVSLMTVYVLMASAQQLPASSWTNPYFFYQYNSPLAMAPQKPSAYQMPGNGKQVSVYDDHSVSNTLGSHIVLLSTCLSELKTTKADLVHTHTEVEIVKKELQEMKGNSQLLAQVMTTVENMKKEINASATSANIGRMPKSCDDLHKIGHRKSGFYPVMGDKTVDNVYCDFTKSINDTGFQKVIGFFDVKTSPVYFHAQKSKSHTTVNTLVPFELLRLNLGNAMNLSGVFIAPKSGKYFFSYSGISADNTNARVELQVKTDTVDWMRVGQAYGHQDTQTFSLQATLELAQGNQIRLMLLEGKIPDHDSHSTRTSLAISSKKTSFNEFVRHECKNRSILTLKTTHSIIP